MLVMSVTLDVFQLDMSALKYFNSLKSPLMSVMAETSQLATGPYVAVAASGSALNAWTAVSREVLVVKVPGGGVDGGGAGEGCVGGGKGDVGEDGGGLVGGDGGGQLPGPQLEP